QLIVDGELGGAISIQNGAVLGGTGTSGHVRVQDGGIIAPGQSIGTLHVDDDIQFDAGAIYAVEANANGDADRIDATGKAIVDGGTVNVLAATCDYDP